MDLEKYFRFTNYYDHPTNKRYKVFHFRKKEMADFFQQLLEKENIPFERDDGDPGEEVILFGIKKEFYERTVKLNFLAWGKHRKPLIRNKAAGWMLILICFTIIGIAIWRYTAEH